MAGKRVSPRLDYRPKMPRKRKVGIGCIGSGFIMADCHLVAYREGGFTPVAIASKHPAHARAVAERHGIPKVHETYQHLLDDPAVEVVDVAVPPDVQIEVVREIAKRRHIRGVLLQKPVAVGYEQARRMHDLLRKTGITVAVNQNMRYDQSIRACRHLLERGDLGEPVLASIDMRAIPHWMPWQRRQGWVTLRIMSIHHLDAFRFLFGEPQRVYCSVRPDPRTARKFKHRDGICLYILEYRNGFRAAAWDDVWAGPAVEGAAADNRILWRVEGTEGMAKGTIGWPDYPNRTPSTLAFTTVREPGVWFAPRWEEAWFPDAFAGPMAELLCALEAGGRPSIGLEDNLKTMALVDACYRSAEEHRAVAIAEVVGGRGLASGGGGEREA